MTSDVLATSIDDVRENIRRYAQEVDRNAGLRDIMAYARGWYACRGQLGDWILAPSKFAGYVGNDAATYVESHRRRDGRRTERALSEWFTQLEPGDAVYDEILAVLRALFAAAGKTPNKLVHIHILEADLPASDRGRARQRTQGGGLLQRITTDPGVLGGRPAIRGMRIGVSDILDMLAAGAGRDEILADYPYLEADDISAALEYAALSIDHRVIRAA